jgi:hypothetical protein
MPINVRLIAVAVLSMGLYGCSTVVQPDTSQLSRPPRGSMTPPEPLPAVATGGDSFRSDSQCSAAYVDVSRRLTSLQGWSARVLKN